MARPRDRDLSGCLLRGRSSRRHPPMTVGNSQESAAAGLKSLKSMPRVSPFARWRGCGRNWRAASILGSSYDDDAVLRNPYLAVIVPASLRNKSYGRLGLSTGTVAPFRTECSNSLVRSDRVRACSSTFLARKRNTSGSAAIPELFH